jgi:hypothetical protein
MRELRSYTDDQKALKDEARRFLARDLAADGRARCAGESGSRL